MSMERWNPFREFELMRRLLDDGPLSGQSQQGQTGNLAVDLRQTAGGYELTAAVPGLRPEDLDITVNRDMIILRGQTAQQNERQEGNYIYHERSSGTFQRVIRLPEPINTERVEAHLEHGELHLTLPRLEQSGNRKVTIRSGATSAGQPTAGQGQPAATSHKPAQTSNQQVYARPMQSTDNKPASERPAALSNLSSTQMNELEQHVTNNDQPGFMATTRSYGWNQATGEQVWRYMNRRVSQGEVQGAFGAQNQSDQPSAH